MIIDRFAEFLVKGLVAMMPLFDWEGVGWYPRGRFKSRLSRIIRNHFFHLKPTTTFTTSEMRKRQNDITGEYGRKTSTAVS